MPEDNYWRKASSLRYCPSCKTSKTRDNFYKSSNGGWQGHCKECQRARKVSPEGQRRAKNLHLKRKYGLTIEQYESLVEAQNRKCKLCGEEPKQTSTWSKGLHVDHNHTTGEVRALLCHSCNTGLGKFYEDPKLLLKAVEYLEGGYRT